VHDLTDALSEPVALASKAETWARDVATNRDNALRIRMIGAEQREQRTPHPGGDLVVISASHKRVHATVSALEVAGQQLHADEPVAPVNSTPPDLEFSADSSEPRALSGIALVWRRLVALALLTISSTPLDPFESTARRSARAGLPRSWLLNINSYGVS
jgi:hypothetical protein